MGSIPQITIEMHIWFNDHYINVYSEFKAKYFIDIKKNCIPETSLYYLIIIIIIIWVYSFLHSTADSSRKCLWNRHHSQKDGDGIGGRYSAWNWLLVSSKCFENYLNAIWSSKISIKYVLNRSWHIRLSKSNYLSYLTGAVSADGPNSSCAAVACACGTGIRGCKTKSPPWQWRAHLLVF